MTFLELVKKRSSLRNYAETPVPEEIVEQCVEAARLAPSACNAQPWHFVVVREPDRRNRLAELSRLPASRMNQFVSQAPVIVALVAEPGNVTSRIGAFLKNKPYYLIDLGIAAEHFCLQAAEEGVGSCMIGWFQEPAVRKLLEIPRRRRVALLITLGYPATGELGGEKRRKESISSDEWYGANRTASSR